MKKLFLLAATAFATGAFAQASKMEIGLEAGPSAIQLRSTNFRVSYTGIGFSGGLSFQYSFHKTFSLRVCPAFEHKGGDVQQAITDAHGYTIGMAATPQRFDYITLPVLIRASVGQKRKFFINAGAFGGYLLQQTVLYNSLEFTGELPDEDNTAFYKRLDAGIVAGAGMIFPVGNKLAISTELRESVGLVNVSKAGSVHTNSTNFLLGIAYRI